MEEAYSNRPDLLLFKFLDDFNQRAKVQRNYDVAFVVNPLQKFLAQMARHEGRWLFVKEIEIIRTVAARDFQHVAEALGRNQTYPHTFTLCECVDDNRCAVTEVLNVVQRAAGLHQHIEHAGLEFRRGRVRLLRDYLLKFGFLVDEHGHEIGEGPTDVGRYSY